MTPSGEFRRTKIVATIGPRTSEEAILAELLTAGVDVVRINSSHGDPAQWGSWIDRVRRVAAALDRHVGVLVDLQGPRIRVGELTAPLTLQSGAAVTFAPEHSAAAGEIPTTYPALAADVGPGATILLDDGLLRVDVTGVAGDRLTGVVRQGGVLHSHKGMNLPGVPLSAPALTATDREHLAAAVGRGADFIGISFVRRAEDVESVRRLVPPSVNLVAKIEKAAAIDDLARILDAADGIMVARGDLGVELPFEEVPLTQKRLIAQANRSSRPVITATQMLESMVHHARPTRAEVSDVANAILDGTDAVMLSAETAVGEYPVEAVRAMARIIAEVERSVVADSGRRRRRDDARTSGKAKTVDEAIALATTIAADLLEVPLIACFTKSGFTARKIAAHRPATPIVGLSTEPETCRCLSLVWGVRPVLVADAPTYEAMLGMSRGVLLARGFAQPGDRIVVTAGVPFHVPGTTNLLKVEVL